MRNEPKKVIMKGYKSEFIMTTQPPYTHYYLWFSELDRYELVRIGQLYKVVRDEEHPVEVDEDHDGNENCYIEECEECKLCGEWYTEDDVANIAEHDHGEYYCEQCAKDLIPCPQCGLEFAPNDDYPTICVYCVEHHKEEQND